MLLADRPTEDLDESMRDEILSVLEGLNAEGSAHRRDARLGRRTPRAATARLEEGSVRDITQG